MEWARPEEKMAALAPSMTGRLLAAHNRARKGELELLRRVSNQCGLQRLARLGSETLVPSERDVHDAGGIVSRSAGPVVSHSIRINVQLPAGL